MGAARVRSRTALSPAAAGNISAHDGFVCAVAGICVGRTVNEGTTAVNSLSCREEQKHGGGMSAFDGGGVRPTKISWLRCWALLQLASRGAPPLRRVPASDRAAECQGLAWAVHRPIHLARRRSNCHSNGWNR